MMNQELTSFAEAMKSVLRNVLNCTCAFCVERPVVEALRPRILEAFERQLRRVDAAGATEPYITPELVHALKMMVRSTEPVLGEVFNTTLGVDDRQRKQIMRELRDDWLLPVCATRQKPFGYFIAKTAEEFAAWMETTRSQAISELAVAYKVFRVNFPELAGQQRLEIVAAVNDGLTEAA